MSAAEQLFWIVGALIALGPAMEAYRFLFKPIEKPMDEELDPWV